MLRTKDRRSPYKKISNQALHLFPGKRDLTKPELLGNNKQNVKISGVENVNLFLYITAGLGL